MGRLFEQMKRLFPGANRARAPLAAAPTIAAGILSLIGQLEAGHRDARTACRKAAEPLLSVFLRLP